MKNEIEIPPEAICRVCGEPMKVVRWADRARAAGLKVPGGEITTIECHDYVLTIDDEEVAQEVVKLLDSYHAAKTSGEKAMKGGGLVHQP